MLGLDHGVRAANGPINVDAASDPIEQDSMKRSARLFNVLGIVGGNGVTVLMVISCWGQWAKVALILAQLIVMSGINVLITARLLPKVGASASKSVRAGVNLVAAVCIGHALGWPMASWAFLPFLCVMVDGRDQKSASLRVIGVIAVFDTFALLGGGTIEMAMSFSFIGLFSFLVASIRISTIDEMLEERAKQTAALATAHEEMKKLMVHALAQEKLAGLGMLAAGVAHEINNPMGYVTSNLCTLLDDLRAAENLTPELIEQRDEVVLETLDGVRRVNAIVSDLRRFASGERENPVSFDVREEVEAAARIVRSQLKPDQRMLVDFPATLIMFGMPRQIGQVLLNLLVNSVQALSGAGEITARGRTTGTSITIEVSDNGTGMTNDTKTKLFQPFFTTKEIGQGTGLGLSVVHGIIQSHQGTIDVTSELGRGTTFIVTLPAVGV